jgi:magnesium-protoporphyrin IX monomethyl ester (oxidative) cyclase
MKIALVNMPFADTCYPSIALTQLRSLVEEKFGERVDAEVLYLNHEFSTIIGGGTYSVITSLGGTVAGLGDWMFRDLAFAPANNADAYFRRHAPRLGIDDAGVAKLLEIRETFSDRLDELIDRHGLDKCDLVGFTTMFSQNVASMAMARRIKERNPKVVTVMGGANCETSMGAVIAKRVDAIDFVFSGPALVSFPKLVECLLEGRPDDCHRVEGVLSKRKVALQLRGKSLEVGEELSLDVEIALDYESFLDSYERLPEEGREPAHLFFETSRGCWWGEKAHCTFCGLNGTGMNYRAMSPEFALRQFEHIFKSVPRVMHFDSVDNILPREYLTDVLPKMKTPEGVELFYEVKADLKDDDLRTLAAAGISAVQPGIESLSTTTLKLMKKGTTAAGNLRFLQDCLKHSVRPVWGLLIGFPGEDEPVYEKYVADIPKFVHLPPPTGVFPVRFDRYSPYFTKADEYGLKLEPYEFYGMIYPFSDKEVFDLAYFFVDENINAPYAELSARWLGPMREGVGNWRALWYQRGDRVPPVLHFTEEGGNVVLDTRSGEVVEHVVGDTARRLLETLTSGMRVPRLVKELGDLSAEAIQAELDELFALNLVFEERGTYLSLLTDPALVAEAVQV